MYELTVESGFSAAHAIVMNGELEPVHGHDWKVRVTLAGETLDGDGLLCDFHIVERRLGEITGRFHNRHLNEVSPFCDNVNPTAELVAKHIADGLLEALPSGVTLQGVRVTEAPGCTITYRP
jgi:6-pyruvoyltetrahydropterin/6-carboxytetrahydropterin synthase